jgi:hypothetical protein
MLHNLLIALALSAAPAAATTQDGGAKAGQDAGIVVQGEKEKKANKRVCKRSVATGSIRPQITCHTNAEWQAQSEKSASAMDAIRKDDFNRENIRQADDFRRSELGQGGGSPR